jgi:hypothetical protein
MPVKCWAACLGACNDVQSREHWVSKAIFTEDHLTIQGLRWCNEPKPIGVAAATSKTLCQRHNSMLAELDSAAGQAFATIRESLVLYRKRQRTLMPWQMPEVLRFRIDAGLLERWTVKTMINLVQIGSPVVLSEGSRLSHGEVPAEMVEIVYGLRPFEGHAGLYVVGANDMRLDLQDRVVFSSVVKDGHAAGAGFELHGLRMLLWILKDAPPPDPLGNLVVAGGAPHASPKWRFKHIGMKLGIWMSHYVDFDWSSAVPREPRPT